MGYNTILVIQSYNEVVLIPEYVVCMYTCVLPGQTMIGLQYGYTKGASQKGMNFGKTRSITD